MPANEVVEPNFKRIAMENFQIKYNQQDNEYYKVLRTRVSKYFLERGISKYANTAMYLKTASIFAAFIGSYVLILSNRFSSWDLFFLQVLFHCSMFVMVVGIAHDGSHNAYSPKRWVNRALTFTFDLVGINSHFWTYNHMYSHHACPNIPLHDSAIESFALVRLHPKTQYRKIHSYQHVFMFAIYAVVTLFQFLVLEFISFSQRVTGYKETDQHSFGQISFMCISKALVLSYTLLIPLAVLDAPAWQVIAGFLAGHMVCGIGLGVAFQTTHLSDFSTFPEPDETGLINHSYAVHIMKTSASFAVNNPVVTFLSGGLNLHTAHHLFPGICQIHLPALDKIVRQTAKEFGIMYKEYTFFGAIASHIRLLKRLGNAPSYRPQLTESMTGTVSAAVSSPRSGGVVEPIYANRERYISATEVWAQIEQQ
jgi:linoleoyl-CoA desaturase